MHALRVFQTAFDTADCEVEIPSFGNADIFSFFFGIKPEVNQKDPVESPAADVTAVATTLRMQAYRQKRLDVRDNDLLNRAKRRDSFGVYRQALVS